MKLIEHFVGGKIIPGTSDKKGKVFNPATGDQEKEVRIASKKDLANAVEVVAKDERVSDSIDDREDSDWIDDREDNLYRHHHDAEDDVGVDESPAVLPEPMDGEAVKSYPEGPQEESHDICIKKRKEWDEEENNQPNGEPVDFAPLDEEAADKWDEKLRNEKISRFEIETITTTTIGNWK